MYKKKIFFFLISCLFFLPSTIYSKENKILLRLNNELITSVDILNEIKYLTILNKNFSKITKNRKIDIAKNSLIKQKIKYIEISKFKKNLSIENNIFEQIIKTYFLDLQIKKINDFELFFRSKNLDPEFVKEKIIIETIWNKLIFEKFSKNVKINKSEIEDSIKKKKIQKEYLLSEIVFDVKKNEKLNQKYKSILNLSKEKNFSEAALIHSLSDSSKNGGKLGWIKEGILSKQISNELSILNIGETTSPLIIPGGFLILHIENIRENEIKLDFEKEMRNIIEKKTNTQLQQLSNVYLNKIKKNIQINEL